MPLVQGFNDIFFGDNNSPPFGRDCLRAVYDVAAVVFDDVAVVGAAALCEDSRFRFCASE